MEYLVFFIDISSDDHIVSQIKAYSFYENEWMAKSDCDRMNDLDDEFPERKYYWIKL